jgi:hypothetical protein
LDSNRKGDLTGGTVSGPLDGIGVTYAPRIHNRGSSDPRCTRQEVQMHAEELLPVKEIVSTLEEGRQRLSDADLVGASRSALTSAREAVADGWPRRRQASRWPWVAGAILGMTVLVVLLTPAFRRWEAARRASDKPDGVMGEVTPATAMSAADDTSDLAHPAEPDALDTAPLLDGGTE